MEEMKMRKPLTEEDIDKMTLMDDVLMSYVFKDNKELAQYFIRTILDNDSLVVEKIEIQNFIPGLQGKTSIFDILAIDDEGKIYDIEMQKITDRATPKRARYHRSKIDYQYLKKGQLYELLPQTFVIFITEKDFFNKGYPLYHIEQEVREDKSIEFDDGTHIIYVNAECEDNNTALGKLMHDIKTADPEEMTLPLVQENVGKAKSFEGKKNMTTEEIMRNLGYCEGWNAGREDGIEKGMAKGIAEGMEKGMAKGVAQGMEKSTLSIAKKLKEEGCAEKMIISVTGLSSEVVAGL